MNNVGNNGNYCYLREWKLEKGDDVLGKNYISADINALLNGEYVKLASVCLVLTPSDHKKLHGSLDHDHYEEDEYVYKARSSKKYCDVHRGIVLSAPYSYELLRQYKQTGHIGNPELRRVLAISDGKKAPLIDNDHDCKLPRHRHIPYLQNWVVEEYGGYEGNLHYGEIHASIDSEFATVSYIWPCLSAKDHKRFMELNTQHHQEMNAYFKKYQAWPWDFIKRKKKDIDNTKFHELTTRQMAEKEAVYEPGKQFIEGHRHLVLSAVYSHDILHKYQKTGRIDDSELAFAIGVAEGTITPSIMAGVINGRK